MTVLGIVTGLRGEARALHRHAGGARVLIATASGGASRVAAETLADNGATALLSFGIAGGLDPALSPGALVIAEAVAAASSAYTTHGAWRRRAEAELTGLASVTIGAIAGRDAPVATVADKAALRATSRAVAVDMESHWVAEVAARRGLPFLAIRAVADPAPRALPRSVLYATNPDGSIRAGALAFGLLRRPGDLAPLWTLSRDYRAAIRTLGRAAAKAAAIAVR